MNTETSGAEALALKALPAALAPTNVAETMTGLRAEIARLEVDNSDLRASADLWSRLYEAATQRATELEARLLVSSRQRD